MAPDSDDADWARGGETMDRLEGTVPGMRIAGVISDVSVEVVAHRRDIA